MERAHPNLPAEERMGRRRDEVAVMSKEGVEGEEEMSEVAIQTWAA